MLIENQFNHPAGDPAIRAILKVRELGKLQNGYLNARFCPRVIQGQKELDFFFLSIYNVVGTLSLRRGSKKHTFGWGNNSQNYPKHKESAKYFRECLIPREGNIFLMVDQVQAEEWPVSALSENTLALAELNTNHDPDPFKHVDRHANLASKIFDVNIPWKIFWTSEEYKKFDKQRYLGKKCKHAKNYGMKPPMMSDSLTKEGFYVPIPTCQILLDKVSAIDPSVDAVFHEYIKKAITDTHKLVGPYGWERMFLGMRPNADNTKAFNEAYSWIPQHTVGSNTGFAVSFLEQMATSLGEEGKIVQEGHDSIVQDIPASVSIIEEYLERTVKSFNRTIRFHNGIEVNIPVEAELGYDFETTVTLKSMDRRGIEVALEKLEQKRDAKKQEQAA
jgi:hypothetical protein